MPAQGPFKKIISWLNADDDEEEFDATMDTMTPPPSSAQPAPPPKRQRGPLTLHSGNEGGMEIRHPRSLEDRKTIGLDLKQRRMVALDLSTLPDTDARYFLEFVYGVIFALDATAVKVSEGFYILAPRGVEVRNDIEVPEAAAGFTAARASSFGRDEQDELFWQAR